MHLLDFLSSFVQGSRDQSGTTFMYSFAQVYVHSTLHMPLYFPPPLQTCYTNKFLKHTNFTTGEKK